MRSAPEYFAVPDPLEPRMLSLWFRASRGLHAGRLRPWPPESRWGRLSVADVPFDRRRRPALFDDFVAKHRDRVAAALGVVEVAIADRPMLAAALFSGFSSKCCFCGKPLTDARSKALAIGPDCRRGMSVEVLAAYADAVRAAAGGAVAPWEWGGDGGDA